MLANKSQLIGQANINSKKLLALEIPVPDLDKQEDCVRQLRTLSLLQKNISTFQKSCLNELDALLPSIVSKIFLGEI
jgi:restriction endonuclease S subunit